MIPNVVNSVQSRQSSATSRGHSRGHPGGEFQVTVCCVTVCPFSRHKGTQRPKCLENRAQVHLSRNCSFSHKANLHLELSGPGPKSSVRPSKSWKKGTRHWGNDIHDPKAPDVHDPREAQKNFGLIFRSLFLSLCQIWHMQSRCKYKSFCSHSAARSTSHFSNIS